MKTYVIDFWMYNHNYDSDVDYTEEVKANSLEDAFDIVKKQNPRARNLKQG